MIAPALPSELTEDRLLFRKPVVARVLGLLDDDADERAVAAAVRAVGRLIQEKRLRAVRISGRDLVSLEECRSFVQRETEAAPLAAAVAQAGEPPGGGVV